MLKNKKSFQITKKRKPKRVENNSSNKLKLETNQIILSGKHSILSALKNKNRKLYYLLLTKESSLFWKEQIKVLNLSLVIKIRTKDELDLMNNYQPHQNSILVTEPLDRISLDEYLFTSKQSFDLPQRIIILDQVTDPQNVGAIIRSAYAFNMDGVALSQSNSPSETSSMAKASSGAIEKIKIIQLSNMSREIKKLQAANFNVYGLAFGGNKTISELHHENGNVAIIVGSEGKGLRRLTKEKVDQLLEIPINKECESLNVANAASIAMFELQKNFIKI
jgi:23S rRNA (guanosine2251-2'-O)-methyltransferase